MRTRDYVVVALYTEGGSRPGSRTGGSEVAGDFTPLMGHCSNDECHLHMAVVLVNLQVVLINEHR